MSFGTLKRPPIKEAVFDLKFSEGNTLTAESIGAFCSTLEGFPALNEIFTLQMQGKLKDEHHFKSTKKINGYRLSDESRAFVLQVRLDGITLSKIEPYISWDELRREAYPILKKLAQAFPDLSFKRIALRYINQFELKFEEPINYYLNILPVFSTELPQLVDSFFVKLAIPKNKHRLKSIIQLGIDPIGNSEDHYKITFDIDVFKEQNYEIQKLDDLFSEFSYIREFKNEIFFNGLTEKVLSQFE